MHKLSRKNTKVSTVVDSRVIFLRIVKDEQPSLLTHEKRKDLLHSVQHGIRPNEENPTSQTRLASVVVIV